MSDPKEKYPYFGSSYVAVFNSSEWDRTRGRRAFIAKFGSEKWKGILRDTRGGIMGIFKLTPTPERVFYVEQVATSSDGRRSRRKVAG